MNEFPLEHCRLDAINVWCLMSLSLSLRYKGRDGNREPSTLYMHMRPLFSYVEEWQKKRVLLATPETHDL